MRFCEEKIQKGEEENSPCPEKKPPSRLLTDAVREVRNTRSRFLSLLVLSALAVCFLAGLRATAPDMKETGDLLFDQQR